MQLNVNAPVKYSVYISDMVDDPNKVLLQAFKKAKKIAVVTDDVVNSLYPEYFGKSLCGRKTFYYVLPHGENNKNADNYLSLIKFLSEKGFCRDDGIIAFGGGVVGDLAGFAAATYLRGMTLVQYPTTVLSMTDSSVGGKTAIDYGGMKNIIGAFYQPKCVIITASFYATLPKREILSGYGEIIKYAFLSGGTITEKDITGVFTARLIAKCLEIKQRIVEADAFEEGQRRLLNLGHTFGHAIESLSAFTLSHGECVVKGLYLTLKASEKLYGIPRERFDAAAGLLTCKGHDISCGYDIEDIQKALYHDKKYDGEKLKFVALDEKLTPVITEITIVELINTLR